MNAYSEAAIKEFEAKFAQLKLARPLRVERYDAGDQVTCAVQLASQPAAKSAVQVNLLIEKFIGGGFAGQVYKVRVLSASGGNNPFQVDQSYALKIFIPPSRGALFFRNLLYAIGFQAPFQLQCNPPAARAGALWQKFIRRAAALRFNDEKAVNDVYGTLVDSTLGSCGEISAWIDGRTWRLEVDDYIDLLKDWEKNKNAENPALGSPEYRAKKKFLQAFSALLHELGAHEFARQYEWTTWKSQPNALKRLETDLEADRGLTAVDFRAGLTLLPFLPMSPGDFKLIYAGIKRGSWVQFDRGNLNELENFIQKNPAEFAELLPLFDELKTCETIYRNSVLDLTRQPFRWLTDKTFRATLVNSAICGWRIKNEIDQTAEEKLRQSKLFFTFFLLLGLFPGLGGMLRKILGRADYRAHYARLFSSFAYFKKTLLAMRVEKIIHWHRGGRITAQKAEKIYRSFFQYAYHLGLSFFPDQVHRFFSDRQYFLDSFYNTLIKPFKLYFDAQLREDWLKEMVQEGEQAQIVSHADAKKILSQIHETFIHKYLQSLAVHIIMAPITRVISIAIVILYLASHPAASMLEALTIVAGILAFFQIIPISPGSFMRGLYVLYVVIRDRNLKDYSLALPLSFFKYIGYFSFPIQMAYRYPTLARCMVGFWTTKMVGVVPVFGESGALLEHKIFTLFYNWPLTIRRKFWERRDLRETQKIRAWHLFPLALVCGILGGALEYLYIQKAEAIPPLLYAIPLLMFFGSGIGILGNLGSGGASSLQRVWFAVVGGLGTGFISTALAILLIGITRIPLSNWLSYTGWVLFVLAVFSAIGAALTEFKV